MGAATIIKAIRTATITGTIITTTIIGMVRIAAARPITARTAAALLTSVKSNDVGPSHIGGEVAS
jgi:hypothetical protein